MVPAEQQPHLFTCGAALPTGPEHLPLLDRRETALRSTCSHRVSAAILVRFNTVKALEEATFITTDQSIDAHTDNVFIKKVIFFPQGSTFLDVPA